MELVRDRFPWEVDSGAESSRRFINEFSGEKEVESQEEVKLQNAFSGMAQPSLQRALKMEKPIQTRDERAGYFYLCRAITGSEPVKDEVMTFGDDLQPRQ